MKHHDESRDLRSLKKIAKTFSPITKTIVIEGMSNVGIRRWGMIDYLNKNTKWDVIVVASKEENRVIETKPLQLTDEDRIRLYRLRKYGNSPRLRIA